MPNDEYVGPTRGDGPPRDYAPPVLAAIERGDVEALKLMVFGGPCACMGARRGEPLCACKMRAREVRKHVLVAGLTRGKIVRVKPPVS